MRRLVFSIIVATGFVMVGSSSASAADPTPAATVSAKSTPGKKLCKIVDKRLDEISGLVATKSGFVAVDDGTQDEAKKKIFFLDKKCAVIDEQEFSGAGPFDPEDLILSADQSTLWIADIGDNGVRDADAKPRSTIALWSMPVSGAKKPVIHRLAYPSGDAHDAEALLLDGDGTPLIVTKEIGRTAGVYQPTGPLTARSSQGVPMKKVADLAVNATETAGNAVARIGNKTITGGAVAPGGKKVALRTYTDALEWDVTGGDVLAALKKEPRTTGLPNEPFGESLSYSADGKTFLTASDINGIAETPNWIRQYTPATEVAGISEKSASKDDGGSWYSDLTVDDITYIVAGFGGLGLLLVAAGAFGIVRFRKSPAAAAADDADDDDGLGLNTADPETELIGVGGAPPRSAGAYGGGGPVYGGARQGPPPGAPQSGGPQSGGPQSGGPQSGGPQRGNAVYAAGAGGGAPAGAPAGGPQYARPGQPPRPPKQQQPMRGPQPPRSPQQSPARGPQPPARAPQAPARGPQQTPARGPQQAPSRGPQQPPSRSPQQTPAGGPQQAPPGRGPQQPPARGPQQAPARGPQQASPRGPQQAPARGPQQAPARGPQQTPARGPQQTPPRGPQQAPGRGSQQPPARGPKQPPARGPQQQPGRGGQQPPMRAPQPPRGPQQGPGVYGGNGGGRPPQGRDDYDEHR